MMIQATQHDENSATVIAGKRKVYVNKFCGQIQVINQNAAHRAYQGTGRMFDSWNDAIEGYKSTAAKAAIEEARTILG